MPFVPLNPQEEQRRPEPCRHPEHYPPSHVVITKRVKWQCPGCGAEVILQPTATYMTDVVGVSSTPSISIKCPECFGTGFTGKGPMNGWNKEPYGRCPRGCPVNCSICGSPNCDNPNGQH